VGALPCILSAPGFGTMAIFGKLAYEQDVAVGDLLLVRFALAAAILLAIAHARGVLRGLSRRSALVALAMGAIGYATQSGLFFSALERMDASLLALILYTYPVLVVAGAIAVGRERASWRRLAGLAAASVGAVRCSPAPRAGSSTRWRPRWASAPRSPTRRTS
jgi:drug/metabolite transporter (DMT)-like permease